MSELFSKLTVNPDNPRTIDKKDFEKLKKSVQSFTKMLRLGKAMRQVTRQFTSGLIDIMKSQANVSIVVSQKLLNGLMFQVNIIVKEMIGLDCVSPATFTMTDTIRHLYVTSDEKYVDVIRKRYHKFVAGSDEGWEKATPAVE